MLVINHMPVVIVCALVVSASSVLYTMLLFDHLYALILTS